MSSDPMSELQAVEKLPMAERVPALAALGRRLAVEGANGVAAPLLSSLVNVIESGEGIGQDRVEIGEVLAILGDPRLRTPTDEGYWVSLHGDQAFEVGKFPVTNAEFFDFTQSGGYEDKALWSEAGWAWLQSTTDPWPAHAKKESSRALVIPNQPVVGVSWYEAEAYANKYNARLPRADERVWVVRGEERRPYPWGAPFGEGNANTREEVLGRPCAVGLYVKDSTPEGVSDLAGNVAEWTADQVGAEKLIHPGAWDQPSMAAWAKALSMANPTSRWAGLGFRLAR